LAKFRADIDEVRAYPSLGIVVNPNDVVDLPADTIAAGLTLIKDSAKENKNAAPAAVEESE
jgi:hypothetical protein